MMFVEERIYNSFVVVDPVLKSISMRTILLTLEELGLEVLAIKLKKEVFIVLKESSLEERLTSPYAFIREFNES